MADKRAAFLGIGAIASIALIVIAVLAKIPTYHAAPLFLVPVVWIIFALRRRLKIAPIHYALLCSGILLHMVGAFGWYQQSPLPFSFDIAVHYWFAVVITLAMYRVLQENFPLRTWHLNVISLMFMMGLGAIHEIMEYCSYLLLGEEKGMLKPKTMYFFDTQRDLTNNLLGALTALAIIAIARAMRPKTGQGFDVG